MNTRLEERVNHDCDVRWCICEHEVRGESVIICDCDVMLGGNMYL